MNILMLSWRDKNNPLAGGAEVFTDECLKRWSKKHNITWFANSFKGCKEKENIGKNYSVVRRGNPLTMAFEAFKFYRANKDKYDLVVDQVNTLPFFTPLYVPKEKRMLFMHQLCKEVWFYEKKFPLNVIGYLLEPLYLSLYRNTSALAVSSSTLMDLKKIKIRNARIIPEGIDFKPLSKIPVKNKKFSLLFVGRLVKSKRVHEIIETMNLLNLSGVEVILNIVGSSNDGYRKKIESQIKELDLSGKVNILGKVSENAKKKLMKESQAILVSSVREGWGLIVTEANALGTPAIVYNSPGLRVAVKNGVTGLVLKKNSSEELFKAIKKVYQDKKLLKLLSENALSDSRKYSWNESAKVGLKLIEKFHMLG